MRPRPALRHIQRFLQKRYRPTDGPTDGRTDQRTDTPSHRDARMHLKRRVTDGWTQTDKHTLLYRRKDASKNATNSGLIPQNNEFLDFLSLCMLCSSFEWELR